MDIKDLKQKILSKNIKISVAGLGYFGLRKAGIKNFVTYDPFAKVNSVNQVSMKNAMSGTDCAIIATDHTIFVALKWPEDMVVVDGRNMLNGRIAKENYYGLGRVRRNS